MATCPNCGNQTGETAVFCDQCGARLPQPEAAAVEPAAAPAGGSVICPACGAGNVPGEAFCDYCGTPLEAPVPSAEPVPEMEPVSSEKELEVEPAAPETPTEEAVAGEPEAEPVTEEEPSADELPPGPAAVAEEAPPAEEPVAPAATAVEEQVLCPACGAEVLPGEAFCANCGASLAQAPISPEPVAEVEPEPAVEPVPEGPPTCPACGTEVEPGDTFCSACGFALKAVTPVAEPVAEAPAAAAPTSPPVAAGPRLVLEDSGAEIPLPAGEEILIGREDPVSGVYPDIDLTPHGGEQAGVSRRHARLIVEGGKYFVEDLDSTNFTFVNKQKLAAKTRQSVSDGDEIRFGRISTVLKMS
jgi:predicted amidophosphoribosyltransferase